MAYVEIHNELFPLILSICRVNLNRRVMAKMLYVFDNSDTPPQLVQPVLGPCEVL